MKQYLPYNVLLAIAVVVTGATLFYNLVLRESFSVLISYEMPAVPRAVQTEAVVVNVGEDESGSADEDTIENTDEPDGEEEPQSVTSVTFPLDINKATVEQLKFIPKVGDTTAQRIVQYREVLGGYENLEQLTDIKGISGKTYENIAAYLICE